MRKSVWLLSAGLFALSTPALAQSTTDTDQGAARPTEGATTEAAAVDNTAVEVQPVDTSDIVVTATRRNEALSDVPLAVSAVTAETLQNSGASDIRQLTQVSPSLLVSSTSSEAGAGVARIRGIGTVGDNPGLESSVALFIDGVYRSRTSVGLTELGQIDRIEVLRGPQGTLFGRNASAGLISVITAKPRFDLGGYGELTLGNYNLRRVEGGVTGPLSTTVAARLDGVYMKRDGFLKDVISGRRINDRDRYLLRGQVLFQPNDDLSVRVIGDFSHRDEECCGAAYLPFYDTILSNGAVLKQPSTIAAIERGLGAIITDDTYSRRTSITSGYGYTSRVKDYGASAELVYDFGGAELTSISAYRFNNFLRGQDADFNNLDILHRADDGGAQNRFKTFSQELRLQGTTFGDRLDWLVGGYYANEKLRVIDNFAYGADYERYANCLLISGVLASALQPIPGGSCINVPVVQGTLAALSALPAGNPLRANIPLFGALIANPARPGFGSIAAALGQPGLTLNGVIANDLYNQTSNNFAVFTHNIFSITDALKLTVGARYTRERKTLDAVLTDNNTLCSLVAASPLSGLQTLPCVTPSVAGGRYAESGSRKSEGKVSGTVVLSYKLASNVLTYASYSRGYKAGGFNLDRSALPRKTLANAAGVITSAGPVLATARLSDLEFRPETNDAFELGFKYNGRGLDLNIAAFHQLFDDFQLNTFNGINFQVENINSCSDNLNGADSDNATLTGACTGKVQAGVRSQGVEVELFTRPMRNVSVNAGTTIVSTRYRDNLVGAGGRPLSSALFALPGSRLSNSSELTLTASAAWQPRIGGSGMSALFYLDGRHQSRFNTGSDLDVEKIQDEYTVFNARVGLRGPNQNWAVELWAQNLLNEDYEQVAFDAPLQGAGTIGGSNTSAGVARGFYPRSNQLFGAFLAEPRTYGLTVRGKF